MSQTQTPMTPCPDCQGRLTAEAFAPVATAYARCTRCGHVFDRARVTPMRDLPSLGQACGVCGQRFTGTHVDHYAEAHRS